MTLTLELTPAQELKLRTDAARAGVDPAALLLTRAGLLETDVSQNNAHTPLGFQEWHRQWLKDLPPAPILGAEDISRDTLYARDDDFAYKPQEDAAR